MNGKGDKQRPTDKGKFDANFDAIFRKKDKDEKKPKGKDNEKPKAI
jgi:uncharacterized protein with von Willebrand factor type A (vWA) domain